MRTSWIATSWALGTTLPTITRGQGSVSGGAEGRGRDTTDRRDFARFRKGQGAGRRSRRKGYDRGILLQGLQGPPQEPGYGATPRTVPGGRLPGPLRRTYAPYSTRGVGFLHSRGDRRAQEVDLGGDQATSLRGDHKGHPLRHQVVEAGHQVGRGLRRHVARWSRNGGRVRHCLLRRRLHYQSTLGGCHGWQGLGGSCLRGGALGARARGPCAPARAAPVLLEER